MAEIRGKTAVVTGGSRGIGLAIAEALAAAGANVALGARTQQDVERAAAGLAERHRESHSIGVVCDVSVQADCETLIERAAGELGGVDILINNAGIGRFAPVAELTPDDWRAVIGTNLDGLFYCTHAALPHLRKRGGWIINIGSLAGRNAFPGGAAYNASKFGLIGFSEALMQEVRHDGVRVSYIMPGSVATDFSHPSGSGRSEDEWKVQPEDIAQIVMDLLRTPDRTLPSRVEVRPSRPPQK
jgi:3-oxoacyl-[acyl-carrier protein] reductase